MNFEELKKIEEQESERAERRAIDRKDGKLDISEERQIYCNLVDSGVFKNPRKERFERK